MIDPLAKEAIINYVREARKRKWSEIEFSWGWQPENNLDLRREICRFAMVVSGARVISDDEGFKIIFT